MRFFKTAEKDKYGIERNLLARSGKSALVGTIPFPSAVLEPEPKLVKYHPIISILGGQAAVLGATDKNIYRGKNPSLKDAVITSAGGASGAAVPAAIIGKYLLKPRHDKYMAGKNMLPNPVFEITKQYPNSFIGKQINRYMKLNTGSFPKVLGKTILLTIPLATIMAPIKYSIGHAFGQKVNPKDYIK